MQKQKKTEAILLYNDNKLNTPEVIIEPRVNSMKMRVKRIQCFCSRGLQHGHNFPSTCVEQVNNLRYLTENINKKPSRQNSALILRVLNRSWQNLQMVDFPRIF